MSAGPQRQAKTPPANTYKNKQCELSICTLEKNPSFSVLQENLSHFGEFMLIYLSAKIKRKISYKE